MGERESLGAAVTMRTATASPSSPSPSTGRSAASISPARSAGWRRTAAMICCGSRASLNSPTARASRRSCRRRSTRCSHRNGSPAGPMTVPDGEAKLTEPASRVSQAALFGGTTTTIDFAPVEGNDSVQQAIERRHQQWAGACYGDYGFHTMLLGKLSPEIYAQVAEAVQAGQPSVKMFTTDSTPSRKGRMVQHGDIWEVLKVLARAGGIAAIHAEDNDIVMHMYEKLMREQRTGFENMAEVHNTLSEDLSFNRVIRLAANIEGAALYMMHTSAATGVRAIATARANGVPIYGETLHQYLMYNSSDYQKPNGQIYHTYPSLKFPEDQAALWAATDHGAIQTVATDEICCPLRIKLQGRRIVDTTGGNAGVEPRVSLFYITTSVNSGYCVAA